MATRVVFFGNSQSEFSNRHFQALLVYPCDLVGVIDVPPTDRDSTNPQGRDYATFPQIADQHNVPIFEPKDPNQVGFIDQIKALQPDLFLSVGYPKILRSLLLNVPSRLAVNFHASLLPAYRGKHPVFWCLRNGERWSGLTVHVMDPGIDTGDLLYQVRIRTRRDDTVSSLYQRIMERSMSLVSRLLADIENNTLTRTPQPNSSASYYSSITENDFCLDWSLPAETLRRWIVITPGQCFTMAQGERIFFFHAYAVQQATRSNPGEIVRINPRNVQIATGDGLLQLEQIRLSDGCQLNLAKFCQRVGLVQGDLFE
jgi:UDP-4-amino-4-deoxy-L-arabinose formyltransferase/UDP-glucuronic acid dehydrogenase (UDP-4-keto-hexauronic acid decarboxylating)